MSLTGDGWRCFVKNKVAFGVCALPFDWVCAQKLQDVMWCVSEALVYTREREGKRGNWFTFCCSSTGSETGGTGCRGVLLLDIFIGCFYLSVLTGGEASRREDSLEDSAEHHVVDYIVLSAAHFKKPTSNLRCVPRPAQADCCVLDFTRRPIRCGPVQLSQVLWGLFYAPCWEVAGLCKAVCSPCSTIIY